MKNKKATRVCTSYLEKNIVKSKRSEGVFGMSFSMIFAIILIVFFLVAAYIGIKALLGWQEETQIGLFINDLQNKIEETWNTEAGSFIFVSSLPKAVEYVCFFNLSSPTKNADDKESFLFEELQKDSFNFQDNLFIYSSTKNYDLSNTKIKHITLSESNPICIKVKQGKIEIKIEKKSGEPLVHVKG